MAVASLIVEIQEGFSEAVLNSLAKIADVSVYGIKDNQIVAVVEGDSTVSVENTMKELLVIDNVVGVFPVYAGDYE